MGFLYIIYVLIYTMQEAAMAERLRRKAELQKKASQPASFLDSLKTEKAKQEEFSKATKEDRRNALCEELGRGCWNETLRKVFAAANYAKHF